MQINIEECKFIPDCYCKSTLILGCGNILFGDDGFGSTVAASLKENYSTPNDSYILVAGTSVRDILFNIALGGSKVKRIILVDAVDFQHIGKIPGEIFELSIDEMPIIKIDDFSMHQIPTSNLLKELRDYCKIDVKILACQIKSIPEKVKVGLSKPVRQAVPKMCNKILDMIQKET